MYDITVILPRISNQSRFVPFCNSLCNDDIKFQVVVCSDRVDLTDINKKVADNIIFAHNNSSFNLNEALRFANGKYVLISDVEVTYAYNAFNVMIENSTDSACVCNVSTYQGKLFRDNFMFDETATKPVYCNHLLRKEIIDKHNIQFASDTDFGIMSFLADYYRFDKFKTVDAVLANINYDFEMNLSKADIQNISSYAENLSDCGNFYASLFYIRNLFNYLYKDDNDLIILLKVVLFYFKDNYAVCSWINSQFGFDIVKFISSKDNKIPEKIEYYKEIKLPMLPDDMAKEFTMGKQGSATLKKCIAGYIDYNIYIKKGNKIIQVFYKIIRKIIGGGSDA